MRLDPDHDLAPASIAAIRSLFAPREPVAVDPRILTRLAMGAADEASMATGARLVASSPSARAELARLLRRAEAQTALGEPFVRRWEADTVRIARDLAEGRWEAGSGALRESLAALRDAWQIASDLGLHDAVETFARSLVVPLMETGEWDALDDLLRRGRLSAEAGGDALLKDWLLSLDGAAAARRGEATLAMGLWLERLAWARTHGFRISQADALLDLASLSLSEGDQEAWRGWMGEAEPAVARTGRADYEATLWTMRATEAMSRGSWDEGAQHAERALATLGGVDGIDYGFYVRIRSAQALLRCGRAWSASDALVSLLGHAAEEGRASHAGTILAELAGIVEGHGDADLAARCLALSLAIRTKLGAREADDTAARMRDLLVRNEGAEEPARLDPDAWEREAGEIASSMARLRSTAFAR